MAIYTKTGDRGTTSLHGMRVPKNDNRLEVVGTFEEVNALIELAIGHLTSLDMEGKSSLVENLHSVQRGVSDATSELSTPKSVKGGKKLILPENVSHLESLIDDLEGDVSGNQGLVYPGGHVAGATLHLARTVARRGERLVLSIDEDFNPILLEYINRLSDYLFVVARYVILKAKAN